MKKFFLLPIVLTLFLEPSCSNSKNVKYSLDDFFKKTEWNRFNFNDFELPQFSENGIDFFKRKSFFNYMIKNHTHIYFERFYLIEILSEGEVNSYNKIIVIENEGKKIIKAYKKEIDWKEYNVNESEKDNFLKCILKKSIKVENGYSAITIVDSLPHP